MVKSRRSFVRAEKFVAGVKGRIFSIFKTPWRFEVSKKREEIAQDALAEMKARGVVREFIRTGNLSVADVIKGVDFYATVVTEKGYKVCPLQVTGKYWVQEHKERHPGNIVVAIEQNDTQEQAIYKLSEAINEMITAH